MRFELPDLPRFIALSGFALSYATILVMTWR
jgi:hypothetical protein